MDESLIERHEQAHLLKQIPNILLEMIFRGIQTL